MFASLRAVVAAEQRTSAYRKQNPAQHHPVVSGVIFLPIISCQVVSMSTLVRASEQHLNAASFHEPLMQEQQLLQQTPPNLSFWFPLGGGAEIESCHLLTNTHTHTLSPPPPQAHMQSGMVPSHHPAQTHPTMMLMATQGPPGGPQPPMPQTALNPIPVSSTAHFSYLAHPSGTPSR